VQPVLNALCTDCHGYEKTTRGGPRAGRLLLTGDRGPIYSHSYYMLTIARLFADGRNQPRSNYDPRALGSSASRLLTMLDGTHHGVRATEHQKKLLRLWIESAAAYPGTYAALGCGMIGNYAENNQVNTGTEWPATKAAARAIQDRCAGCHDKPARLLPHSLADERGVSFWQPSLDDPRLLTSRHIVFNLTRPEKSLVLLAPLSKEAGGWGLCRNTSGTSSYGATAPAGKSAQAPQGGTSNTSVFASTADPGYEAIHAMIVAGKDFIERDSTRFDMPNFKPRPDWVREMRRYGVLPECAKTEEISDAYAIEQDYWKSLWHQPPPSSRAQKE
jgi:cytochrome c553